MDEALLQALRNVTREHMRLLRVERGYTDEEIREEIICVKEALRVMKLYNFKQDRPL